MMAQSGRKWVELEVTVPGSVADTTADFLFDLTGRGVCIKESGAVTVIRAYTDAGAPEAAVLSVRRYLDSLAAMGVIGNGYRVGYNEAPEEDWMSVFRAQHTTVRVSERLVVRPSWCSPCSDHDVVLDPGMAFGTGSHATTRMCLELLDSIIGNPPRKRMLDLGTGSGILAIAAAYLGVEDILAVDIDPDSVRIARENALANHLEGRIAFAEGSVEQAQGPYGIVAANLATSLIKRLADDLAGLLVEGGHLIASGVMESEQSELEAAMAGAGLSLVEARSDDIWLAELFVR